MFGGGLTGPFPSFELLLNHARQWLEPCTACIDQYKKRGGALNRRKELLKPPNQSSRRHGDLDLIGTIEPDDRMIVQSIA